MSPAHATRRTVSSSQASASKECGSCNARWRVMSRSPDFFSVFAAKSYGRTPSEPIGTFVRAPASWTAAEEPELQQCACERLSRVGTDEQDVDDLVALLHHSAVEGGLAAVRLGVDVGILLDQQLDDIHVPALRRELQRRLIVCAEKRKFSEVRRCWAVEAARTVRARVHVGAFADEELRNLEVAPLGGRVQRRQVICRTEQRRPSACCAEGKKQDSEGADMADSCHQCTLPQREPP